MKRGMRFAYPLASFSLKKSLTKRRLCEAYGLGGTQASDPSRPPPPRHRHFAFYGKKLGKNHYGFLQRKHSQRIASFFMVKNLDQETSMPKAQWKVFWRCKRGRPMEGRPRTSILSFSLPLVCSLILNGIVIFMFLKLNSLVKGLRFKIALFKIDVKYYFNITCIELKYLSSLLSCDIKILYYNILLFLNL